MLKCGQETTHYSLLQMVFSSVDIALWCFFRLRIRLSQTMCVQNSEELQQCPSQPVLQAVADCGVAGWQSCFTCSAFVATIIYTGVLFSGLVTGQRTLSWMTWCLRGLWYVHGKKLLWPTGWDLACLWIKITFAFREISQRTFSVLSKSMKLYRVS